MTATGKLNEKENIWPHDDFLTLPNCQEKFPSFSRMRSVYIVLRSSTESATIIRALLDFHLCYHKQCNDQGDITSEFRSCFTRSTNLA